MRYIYILFIVSFVNLTIAQQTNESIDVGGINREYIQYLPVGFNQNTESLPVVFVLHGLGGSNSTMTNIGFKQIGDSARVISIYPQGIINAFGQSSWDNGTLLAPIADDVTFFNNMIDHLIQNYNIDQTRIYCTGISMGGIMSYHLACELNERFAAIGAMSGTMATDDIANCVPTYKTPVIHVHGTADATVPYYSSPLPSLSLVGETMNFWINVHQCLSSADSTQLPNNAADGLTVDRFIYQACTPESSLELLRVNGGGHTYFYEPVNDFTEAAEIWLFFRKWFHYMQQINISDIPKDSFTISPNPSNGLFKVKAKKSNNIYVYNLSGQLIHKQLIYSGENILNLSVLKRGVYILKYGSKGELNKRISIQ